MLLTLHFVNELCHVKKEPDGSNENEDTYHCLDFIPNQAFGVVNLTVGADNFNVAFDVGTGGWRYVDLCAGGGLHIFDCFTAFTNNHTNSFRRDIDEVVDATHVRRCVGAVREGTQIGEAEGGKMRRV